jgi:EAL domain-containing protein (putative c-di-GMP-specific phosphodiesterase class I)
MNRDPTHAHHAGPTACAPEAHSRLLHASGPTDPAAHALGDLLEIVLARRIGVEYQPIVEVATGAVVGHEALARFYDPEWRSLPPAAVFARLHAEPSLLLHVELETKRLQLAHAPPGALHVNVDPDSYALAAAGSENALVRVLAATGRRDIVVEVIENMSVSDARLGRAMVRELERTGLGVALDDVGKPDALLSLEVLKEADVVKLDRSWFGRLYDSAERLMLESLVSLARRLGARTMIEGAETAEHVEIARALGIDCVQGFLFADRFVYVRP